VLGSNGVSSSFRHARHDERSALAKRRAQRFDEALGPASTGTILENAAWTSSTPPRSTPSVSSWRTSSSIVNALP
jgi:hypothetical protein